MFLFFLYLRNNSYLDKDISNSTLLTVVPLLIIGFLGSEFYPIVTLIKLSPQRATFLLSIFFTLGLSNLIHKRLKDEQSLTNLIIVYLCLCFSLIATPGPPLILLLLTCFLIPNGPLECRVYKKKLIVLYLVIAVLILVTYFFSQHFVQPFKRIDVSYLVSGGVFRSFNDNSFLVFLISIAFCFIFLFFKRYKKQNTHLNYIFVLIAVSFSFYLENHEWKKRYSKEYKPLLEAQEWASKNSPREASFWVDPVFGSNWLGYSDRRKIGSFRDWTFYYLVYTSHETSRYDEFVNATGYEIKDEFFKNSSKYGNYSRLQNDFKNYLESLSSKEIATISDKLNFDFVLRSNKYSKDFLSEFTTVYENSFYQIKKIK